MTTKKDAAAQLIWLAKEMRRELGGDELVDDWASFLDAVAYSLDRPTGLRNIFYCTRHGHQLKDLPMEVYCLRCGWRRGREDWP